MQPQCVVNQEQAVAAAAGAFCPKVVGVKSNAMEDASLKLELRISPTKTGDMSALKRLRNLWIRWITTIVLACFSEAAAQASYKVTDLGTEGNDNQGCALSLNNQGCAEIMAGNVGGAGPNSVLGKLLNGRALIDVNGFNLDLGTLGGLNTWMSWGEINESGQIVRYSETNVPDPNGEDVCGFGTHLTCLPFLWQFGYMRCQRR